MKHLLFILAAAAMLLHPSQAKADRQQPNVKFDKLGMVHKIIEAYYLDDVDDNKLTEEAIVAMLKTLDPHSAYSNPDETKELLTPLEGNFSGIGIQFNMLNDTLVVIQTTASGPSERVGLLPGDKILKADTVAISGAGKQNRDILKTLRGPKGTEVDITVKRRNVPDPILFRITRDDIPVNSVDAFYMVSPGTGYIRLSRFSETSAKEVNEALSDLSGQGMKRLIFDLEDNGGGVLGAAVDIAELFLKKGQLVTYTESPKMGKYEYVTERNGRYSDMPLVVMVNQYSASASEILSGALQDHDRAVIVGRRSFGKGLVQRPFPLPDGSLIRLTVSRYHTPSGRVIQKPYEAGNADSYYSDIKTRYDNGEFYSADSISFPDSLKYTTLQRQRTVYGGGGIMPDQFVPLDTALYSDYYRDLMAKGVFNKFCINYVNENRADLKAQYPDADKFVSNFKVSDALVDSFTAMGEKEGVPFDKEQSDRSSLLISTILKGLIGRDMFDSSTYFRIVNPVLNPIYTEAVDIISSHSLYDKYLEARQQ